MGDLCDFERGQNAVARLAGAYMTKTATLLGVSIPTVSKVMSAYTYHEKTTSAKRNSGRKSTLTGIDRHAMRRIVSKNHRTTAAQVTAEVNIHLEDSISTKTVRRELHKSNAYGSGMAAIAKPLITESNAQMCKR
jgi:transposase